MQVKFYLCAHKLCVDRVICLHRIREPEKSIELCACSALGSIHRALRNSLKSGSCIAATLIEPCEDSSHSSMLDSYMSHGFDPYRVFISAPGDLDQDRDVCHDAIARTNETIAMPAKILLVTLGLRDNNQIAGSRSIVSDNVRWSTYFIQIFEDDWGPRDLFRKLFFLAIECRNDAAMPMRDVVVFLKDAPRETNAEILAFRRELETCPDVRVFPYHSANELSAAAMEACGGWAAELVASVAPSAVEAPTPADA